MMMKTNVIAGLVTIWATLAPCQARLGETLQECQNRYGAPLAKISAKKCLASDDDVYLFGISDQGRQLTLRVEFYRGKAWFLGYSSTEVKEFQPILVLNKGAADWGPPLVQSKRHYWMDVSGNDRMATAYRNTNKLFVDIATMECVRHLADQRKQDWQAVLDGKVPAPAAPTVPGAAPVAPAAAPAPAAPTNP